MKERQKLTRITAKKYRLSVKKEKSKILEKAGCPLDLQSKIVLAVEEVFVNIVYYAYKSVTPSEIGGVIIRMAVDSEVNPVFFWVVFRAPIDPEEIAALHSFSHRSQETKGKAWKQGTCYLLPAN